MTAAGLKFSLMTATLQLPDHKCQLVTALRHFAESEPPVPFAGRYLLTDDVVEGGQGVVTCAQPNSVCRLHRDQSLDVLVLYVAWQWYATAARIYRCI